MSVLTARLLKPELMDNADAAEAAVCLRDLARINRWFGGHRVLVQTLQTLLQPGAHSQTFMAAQGRSGPTQCEKPKPFPPRQAPLRRFWRQRFLAAFHLAPVSQERFSMLDVGAASGDMGRTIRGRFPGATVVSLDYRPSHLRLGQGPRVAADAFQLPFRPRSFDFVLCSLFLHHFSDSQVVELIAALRQIAGKALIVLDLERHPFPYHFLPATRRLLRWSPMTVHDGVISVGAAFRPAEILALVRASGGPPVRVRRHLPWFRLSAVIPAEENPAVLRPIKCEGGTQ